MVVCAGLFVSKLAPTEADVVTPCRSELVREGVNSDDAVIQTGPLSIESAHYAYRC